MKVTSRTETKIQSTLLSKTQNDIICCYQKCVVPIPFIFLVEKCFNIFDEISFLQFKRMYFVQCTVFVPVVLCQCNANLKTYQNEFNLQQKVSC